MYNAITVALDIHLDCSLGGYMEGKGYLLGINYFDLLIE